MIKKRKVRKNPVKVTSAEIAMLKKDLIMKCWVDSGCSNDLYQVTSRLEQHAKEKTHAKQYCDRVYDYLADMGIHTTKDVKKVLAGFR